ncbi:MAG: hypothetical protein E7Z68_06205 [Thermoplasmata archaeon]|nr:hypothetical protein [Thermoplasmata archaeon]
MTRCGTCFCAGSVMDHATLTRTPEGMVVTVVQGGRPASFVLDMGESLEMSRSLARAVEGWRE